MDDKLTMLQEHLRSLVKLAIALSGGVDSCFLATVARGCLGRDAVLALHVTGPFIPAAETARAASWAAAADIPFLSLTIDMLAEDSIRRNTPDRCYHCKRLLMGRLQACAAEHGFEILADGSNCDDLGDYRPGRRAGEELGVRHPLEDAGFHKADIRRCARDLGLPNWDLPAAACLASRIPTGTSLDADSLRQVEAAEAFLHARGFLGIRVRHYGRMAKIEAPPEAFAALLALRADLLAFFSQLGFSELTLDLAGYRMGAMNAPAST